MSEPSKRATPVVLIVDDDRATRNLLAAYLEAVGCSTVLVASGEEAIQKARELLPDVIVNDVMMPGPGGLETLFLLRQTPETAHIPAVVVSGISRRIFDLIPCMAYLVKPVDRAEFVAAVRECINASRNNQSQPTPQN
jgi:CheY-like chemotaxis protein